MSAMEIWINFKPIKVLFLCLLKLLVLCSQDTIYSQYRIVNEHVLVSTVSFNFFFTSIVRVAKVIMMVYIMDV